MQRHQIDSKSSSISSNSKVIIYSFNSTLKIIDAASLNELHLISFDNKITHVAISNANQIAVAFENSVKIFMQESGSWILENELEHQDAITSLCFSSSEYLLISSSILNLWIKLNNTWSLSWSSRVSNPIIKSEFSQDSTFFCTNSLQDRFPKLFYKPNKSDSAWHFIYLKHPSPIVYFEWRQTRTDSCHVLLTTCMDNVSRLWCQLLNESNDYYKKCRFIMNAVIDPSEFPASVVCDNTPNKSTPIVSYTSSNQGSNDSIADSFPDMAHTISTDSIVDYRHSCPVHFLNSRELGRAVDEKYVKELDFLNRILIFI